MVEAQEKRSKRIAELKRNIINTATKRAQEASYPIAARNKNLLLNDFEYATGKIALESSPEGIGIGTHYACNGKCVFCLGGKPRIFSLERYREFFEPRLENVLSRASYVSFCGFGELFLMPRVEEFMDYVNKKIPWANKIYTTNGAPLANDKILNLLTQSQSAVQISLHASHRELHRALTKLDSFDEIVARIRQIISMRKSKERPSVILVFLINSLNVENLADFVEFAHRLRVDEVRCNYMTAFHHSQLKLSCFFKQELTNRSLEEAEERAAKLDLILKLPPRFGRGSQGTGSLLCAEPWKYIYVENESSVLPCCYAGSHFGYLDRMDFQTIWNGSSYRQLRKSLVEGPPHKWCKHCQRYRAENINDIRSHINFRPGGLLKILKGYKL
ncbi:MAG: radical SAM protein [Patescibacteria group bacterium]